MSTNKSDFSLEIVDLGEIQKAIEQREFEKAEALKKQQEVCRFDGLTFEPIFEKAFPTFIIYPSASNNAFGEMLIDTESQHRFKLKEPTEAWKVYDIYFREKEQIKQTVHKMYRHGDNFANLGYCVIKKRPASTIGLVICGTAPCDEKHSSRIQLRHIFAVHSVPKFINVTGKLSYGILIRSQFQNSSGIWVKATGQHITPWIMGSRKRARQYCHSHIPRKENKERDELENTQTSLFTDDNEY
jgi:hypothetical protein